MPVFLHLEKGLDKTQERHQHQLEADAGRLLKQQLMAEHKDGDPRFQGGPDGKLDGEQPHPLDAF